MRKTLKRGDEFGGARVMGDIPMNRNGDVQAVTVFGPDGLFLLPKPQKSKRLLARFTEDEKEILLWAALSNGVSLNNVLRALVRDYGLSHRSSGAEDFPAEAAERLRLLKRARMDSVPLIPASK